MNSVRDYRIGVIGAGSWGTALANMLAEKGYSVTLWVYERELLELLLQGRCNTWYLPERALDERLEFTGDLNRAVADKQVLLWVTPVKVFRELFARALQAVDPSGIHASASKGIEIQSLKTISQIARELMPGCALDRFAVVSGPSFAQEVALKMPSAVVSASCSEDTARTVQSVLATHYFRTYTSTDVPGVELGGALKNVMAIAAGIVAGLGFGANTRAALITRGLAEIMRLGAALGADPLTFSGLSGIGDLLLTCTSTQSRNYTVGLEIGRGARLEEIMKNMKMVAEGVYTAQSAHALADKHGIDMPIVREIYAVLFDDKPPRRALEDLMGRDLKQETR
ncbi:MAG: NAD(P)-dependent glycerol-3-phosphate dehydrogenase [Deltaproteobacteria bacterium]|nr:NAD(P)-dependent glycerol-3-phosphate dehydrogenase [Deltaproteobacteria bacterium]